MTQFIEELIELTDDYELLGGRPYDDVQMKNVIIRCILEGKPEPYLVNKIQTLETVQETSEGLSLEKFINILRGLDKDVSWCENRNAGTAKGSTEKQINLTTTEDRRPLTTCYYCGKKGHTKRMCRFTKENGKGKFSKDGKPFTDAPRYVQEWQNSPEGRKYNKSGYIKWNLDNNIEQKQTPSTPSKRKMDDESE